VSDQPEKAANLLAFIRSRMSELSGTCDEHGDATVLVRIGLPWHCPACAERKLKIEGREQWLKTRLDTLRSIANFPARHSGKRFVAHTQEQRDCRAMAAAFRDFIIERRQWAALVLIGSNGTGKSLLATELGESCVNKFCRSVRYTTAHGMIAEIQASYGREGKSEEAEIERFVQFDLLIIDEIDAKRDTDAANLLLTEVIGRRYNAEKPVVVISNQSVANLPRFVGDRVGDRLRENNFTCAFTWPSFRGTT
jgi:DNA replication protein DnaC